MKLCEIHGFFVTKFPYELSAYHNNWTHKCVGEREANSGLTSDILYTFTVAVSK